MNRLNIVVGMSGGVDSSVAAYLLKEAGHQVTGLFMKNWEGDDAQDFCPAKQDADDAQSICQQLDIPFYTVNFAQHYWDNVFRHFLTEYQAGRTPNPDVLCNKEIKFRAFLDYAQQTFKADYIATGHYVQKTLGDSPQLLKAIDLNKDQSYFLYQLNEIQLAKSLFPIGALKKSEVREIAKKQGFITHNKKDSTGICFIGERKFKNFLREYLPAKPGDIVNLDHQVIGRHEGLMYYTLGQRQGLGIGGKKSGGGQPWYVVKKELTTNRLYVVQGAEHPALYTQALFTQTAHWINHVPEQYPLQCTAKTRYRETDKSCTLFQKEDNRLHVIFEKPERAVTPGQSIVFYQGNICLGGAVIEALSCH